MPYELSATLRNALLTGLISFVSALLAAQTLDLHVVEISFLGAVLGAALSYQSAVNPTVTSNSTQTKTAALSLLKR